jgi:hypothetical protein
MPIEGIARSTYYDKPAISIDDTALGETMVAISESGDVKVIGGQSLLP